MLTYLILDGVGQIFLLNLGSIIMFFGLIAAVYIAELAVVGKKRSSIKKAFMVSLLFSIVAVISNFLFASVPILAAIIMIFSLALLIQHFHEGEWFIIFTLVLAVVFVIIVILALASMHAFPAWPEFGDPNKRPTP
ncbi:MAG: hypothetical protein JSV05_02080 [Candidatus Bathyarchaeota archaeon]|nr:MAG: hypothetical protein JSV05_02080 [Candidatus Bathyarchaeota archaeon]